MIDNEIELGREELERIGNVFRGEKYLIDDFGEGLYVIVLRAWKPSFLDSRCVLFRAEYGNAERQRSSFWVFADIPESPVLSYYADEPFEAFASISFALGEPCLHLDDVTSPAYLRAVLTGWLQSAVLVENPDDFAVYEPLGPHGAEKVVFYSDLEFSERGKIAGALNGNPLSCAGEGPDFLAWRACVLSGDSLKAIIVRVYTCDQQPSFGMSSVKRIGQIELVGARETLVSGLPTNYMIVKDEAPGFVTMKFPLDVRGWQSVGFRENEAILRDIGRFLTPFIVAPHTFRRKYLPFYGLDLLQIAADSGGKRRNFSILWKPGTVIPLDGTSTPIHDVNEAIARVKGRDALLRTPEDAAEYVRFFCTNVWGDEGPFLVVESADDPALEGIERGKLDVNDAFFASVDEFLASLRPLVPGPGNDPELDIFEVSAFILYGEAVFKARFAVTRNGMVEMIDDEPLAGVEGRLIPEKPFGAFRKWVTASALEAVDAGSVGGETVKDKLIVGRLSIGELATREFVNCRFRGLVDLSGVSTEQSLLVDGCVFEGGLAADEARFGGNLKIYDSLLCTPYSPDEYARVSMTHLTCAELVMVRVFVSGGLGLSGIIAQRVQLETIAVAGGLDIDQGAIEQVLGISDLMVDRSLDLFGTEVRQNYLGMGGPFFVGGDLNAGTLRVGTSLYIESSGDPLVIKGNLVLSGAEIPQTFRLRNAEIGGNLEARFLDVGMLRLLGGRVLFEKPEEEPSEAKPLSIGGSCTFDNSKIRNTVWVLDVEMSGSGLSMRAAEIGGDVLFFSSAAALLSQGYYLQGGGAVSGFFTGGVDFSQAKIGGEVDLTGVQCASGGISLDGGELSHDFIIRSGEGYTPARVLWLSMDSVTCHGTAGITGLEIPENGTRQVPDSSSNENSAAPSPEAPSFPGSGVSARFSSFERGFIAASRDEAGRENIALIGGLLDLTGSVISELSVSTKSFPVQTVSARRAFSDAQPSVQKIGIVLNQATVNKLTSVIDDKEYPRPIDLRYAEIKWWDFRSPEGSHSGTSRDFIELLKGDPHLQRHTFRSIERNLIDQGNEEAADAIHKEMRRWIRAQPGQPVKNRIARKVFSVAHLIKRGFLWLWDAATDSNTSPYRLLTLVILWIALSSAMFSLPENISPSTEALIAARGELSGDSHPSPSDWNGMAPFWMAIRFHVPVAAFSAQDDWQPSQEPLMLWKAGPAETDEVRITAITAEDYANIVTGLHWILWPVILILASRKFFRNYEK